MAELTCNGHCDGIQRLSNLIDRLAGEHATVVLRLDTELEHVARYLAAVRAVRCGHGPGERHATVYPDHGGWRVCLPAVALEPGLPARLEGGRAGADGDPGRRVADG